MFVKAWLLTLLGILLVSGQVSALDAPNLSVTRKSSTSVKVTWTIPSGVSIRNAILVIQRSSSGRRFVSIGEFSNPRRRGTYTDSLLPDGTYRYRARLRAPVRTVWSTVRSVSVTADGGFSTPKPTAAPRYFEGNGDVTSLGKQRFEIPSQLSANVTRGRTVWSSVCSGCHASEKRDRTFPTLKSTISGSPMFLVLSQATLGDLVAYLNRFRIP